MAKKMNNIMRKNKMRGKAKKNRLQDFKEKINFINLVVFYDTVIAFVIEVTRIPCGTDYLSWIHPAILFFCGVFVIIDVISFYERDTNSNNRGIIKKYIEAVKILCKVEFDKLFELIFLNTLTIFLILVKEKKEKLENLSGGYFWCWLFLICIFVILNCLVLRKIKKSKVNNNDPKYYWDYGIALVYGLCNTSIFLIFHLPLNMLVSMCIIVLVYIVCAGYLWFDRKKRL